MQDINFESNIRRIQEKRMRPYADELYRQVFGDVTISRFERDEETILDIHYAIDVQIEFSNGLILTGQEKFLSNKYIRFHSITVEYMNDPINSVLGDWFNLASQFYMTGYEALGKDGFVLWVIANWPAIILNTIKGNIYWNGNDNQDGHAKASFKYCDMFSLPKDCIIASSFMGGNHQ